MLGRDRDRLAEAERRLRARRLRPLPSLLLAITIAGLPDLRTRSAKARSTGVGPARASMRKSTTSAAAIAASVCACMRPVRLAGAASSSPAVSIAVKARSPSRARPSRRSRVTPGRSSTSARRLPTSRLNSVDLPTFGRPTMATVKLMTKRALWRPLYARRGRWAQSARERTGRRRVGPSDLPRRLLRFALGAAAGCCAAGGSGHCDAGCAPVGRTVTGVGVDCSGGLATTLGLGLALGFGFWLFTAVTAAVCGSLGRRLIALDQFLRYALRHPRRAFREYRFAFARQLLLGAENVRTEHVGRIEGFASGQRAVQATAPGSLKRYV